MIGCAPSTQAKPVPCSTSQKVAAVTLVVCSILLALGAVYTYQTVGIGACIGCALGSAAVLALALSQSCQKRPPTHTIPPPTPMRGNALEGPSSEEDEPPPLSYGAAIAAARAQAAAKGEAPLRDAAVRRLQALASQS